MIVDVMTDTFGGNENDRGQVRQYVSRALGSIATALNGAVVACAHPSRTGINSGEGDGGSTAWSNAFRSRLFLATPQLTDGEAPDRDARVLFRKKANYAARNDEIRLRWRDGVIVVDHATDGFSAQFGRRAVEDVFMDLLDALTAEGRPLSATKNAGNYAPTVFATRPDREGYRKSDFARALETLFSRKLLTTVEYGRKGDERRKLIRA